MSKFHKHLIILIIVMLAISLGCSKEPQNTDSGESARSKPYVASVLRDPYHLSSCKWAEKISTENLVGYDKKEQAEADGHRACKVCRP